MVENFGRDCRQKVEVYLHGVTLNGSDLFAVLREGESLLVVLVDDFLQLAQRESLALTGKSG